MQSVKDLRTTKFVFLDRDGTINIDLGYVTRPEQVYLIAGAAEAIASLKRHGFTIVVVTNQSAVGREMASIKDIEETHEALRNQLVERNPAAVIDDIFVCPHLPEDRCNCRKPKIGLVQHLINRPHFQSDKCWIVGDKLSDLEFGKNFGIPQEQRVLVLTGHGEASLEEAKNLWSEEQLQICKSLQEAADVIIGKQIEYNNL